MSQIMGGISRKIKQMLTCKIDAATMTDSIVCSHDEKQAAGWASHDYNVSRKIELNRNFCMENRCVAIRPESPEMDSYRVLRTHILQKAESGSGNLIMVTSALPGEGKTLTAINLALALAHDYNETALLVDCNLRQQGIHRCLGIQSDKGLINYLLNDTPISELILWPGIDKLTFISGGRPFLESSELLGSSKMQALVLDMKTRYPDRYVIFDAPAILSGADALAFAPLVDNIVIVVQAEKTSTYDIQKAIDLIPKEKILGMVLNRVKSPSSLGYPANYQIRR